MKEKLKSIPLWASILCLIGLIAKNWIGHEIPAWNDISEQVILGLGIAFGVVNNPNDRLHF